MTGRYTYNLLIIILLIITSCEYNVEQVIVPEFPESLLKGTSKVTEFAKEHTEGIYIVTSDFKPFGDTVVFKWTRDVMSIFTGQNTAYAILNTGRKPDELIFEGYWRHANSELTGLISMSISRQNGAFELSKGEIPTQIIVDALYGGAEGKNMKPFKMIRIGGFKNVSEDYWIIAHKGGGRNIDRLPYSENSVELIRISEYLGANAIEIDIRLTKDKIPVLFHDEFLSLRTVNNEYLIGRISDYTYKQLRATAPLKYGEKIPSLDDALKSVVEETNLKLVWLDIKDEASLPKVIELQSKYLDRANKLGRNLEILIGIPEGKVYDYLIGLDDYQKIPTLCELKEEYAIAVNSQVWAPRWSLGLLKNRVEMIHSIGKRAFVWTLDDPVLIKKYIEETEFDGMVTNFSPVLAYEYYIKK